MEFVIYVTSGNLVHFYASTYVVTKENDSASASSLIFLNSRAMKVLFPSFKREKKYRTEIAGI